MTRKSNNCRSWDAPELADLLQVYKIDRKSGIGWVFRAVYLRHPRKKVALWITTAIFAMIVGITLLAETGPIARNGGLICSMLLWMKCFFDAEKKTFGKIRVRVPSLSHLGKAGFEAQRLIRFRVGLREVGISNDPERLQQIKTSLRENEQPDLFTNSTARFALTLCATALIAVISSTVPNWPSQTIISVALILAMLSGVVLIIGAKPPRAARLARLEKFLGWCQKGTAHGGIGGVR